MYHNKHHIATKSAAESIIIVKNFKLQCKRQRNIINS